MKLAKQNNPKVGIGLGANPNTIQKINSAIEFVESNGYAHVQPKKNEFDLLSGLLNGTTEAIVRGAQI